MAGFAKYILPALCATLTSMIAGASLVWWLDRPLTIEKKITLQLPGLDGVPPGSRNHHQKIQIGQYFRSFKKKYNHKLKGEWPRFRGADFSNIRRDGIKLANHWGPKGPPVLWRKKLGEGYAGPVIYRGRVFVLDYLEDQRADGLRCFSLATGEELWRRWYKIEIKRNHGRSRTVPAVNQNYVVTLGPMGQVMCVDTETGQLRWGLDLVEKYGAIIPQWYTGQCPLLDGEVVVVAVGGPKVLLLALDGETGRVLWKTPNPHGWKMSHSSVITTTFRGQKMYVYFAVGGILGVAGQGPKTGEILWKTSFFSPSVAAPSPVVMEDGWIYLTAGYGAGSTTFQLQKTGETFSIQKGKTFRPRQALALEQQTAIYHKGVLYGIMPKDGGPLRLLFIGVDGQNPWKILCKSRLRFGLGPFLLADEKFYLLDDEGMFTMLSRRGAHFKVLGRCKILPGKDSWGPLALADGLMVVRDSTSMACIDLRKKNTKEKE